MNRKQISLEQMSIERISNGIDYSKCELFILEIYLQFFLHSIQLHSMQSNAIDENSNEMCSIDLPIEFHAIINSKCAIIDNICD